MNDLSREDLEAMAQALADWPASGKPQDVAMLQTLRAYGLVEEQHTNKSCPACGTEKPDHYWWKISLPGRVFMMAMGVCNG